MSVGHTVGVFSYQSKTFSLIAGSTSGFKDDKFSQVRFSRRVALTFLDSDTLLVADRQNNRLRVLNLITNTSYSICSGERGHSDGDFSTCSLDGPYGLLVLENDVYTGTYQRIRIIERTYI